MNGNQNAILQLVKAVAGQNNILTIPRLFITLTGSADTALFLSRLLYWSDRAEQPGGFIHKSSREWQEELGLSDYRVRKAAEDLQDMGLLEVTTMQANGSPTLHYRPKRDEIVDALIAEASGESIIATPKEGFGRGDR